MTKLLLGAHMSIAGGVSQALDRAATVHSNAVQVFTKNNRQWAGPPVNGTDVARWQVQMPALGIANAVSHASYLINLASPSDELWEKSIAAHRDEIQRAHAYGIANVVLHPGAHTGAGVDAGIARIAAALNRIHAATPECAGTVTCLEIMAGQGSVLGRSLEELRAMIEQVAERDRVAVCLDTCHAFAAGYDIRSAGGYADFVAAIEQVIGLETVHVWHLNDSKGALGSNVDRHTHIGEGEIGLDGFRWVLNDLRWAGVPMLLETPKEDTLEEDAMNLARLCALVEDPERISEMLRQAEQDYQTGTGR